MELQIIQAEFTICQIEALDPSYLREPFCFVSKTDTELSLVCDSAHVPAHTLAQEDGWRMFRFSGTLDFSLVGILARICEVLQQANISLFAVSTYQTDYVLVKTDQFSQALSVLQRAGYQIGS